MKITMIMEYTFLVDPPTILFIKIILNRTHKMLLMIAIKNEMMARNTTTGIITTNVTLMQRRIG